MIIAPTCRVAFAGPLFYLLTFSFLFSATEDTFKDIQITLPTNMKGWSGKRPAGGPTITYHVKGFSFMSSTAGAISSSYTWSFSSPPTLAEARSDPFKLVQYELYLIKTRAHAEQMKLVDPATAANTLAILNRADLVKQTEDNFADKTGGGMLLAYEDQETILIYYYVEGGPKKLPFMERVKRDHGFYVLEPTDPAPDDNRPINFFTAFYDTFTGVSNDIQVTR